MEGCRRGSTFVDGSSWSHGGPCTNPRPASAGTAWPHWEGPTSSAPPSFLGVDTTSIFTQPPRKVASPSCCRRSRVSPIDLISFPSCSMTSDELTSVNGIWSTRKNVRRSDTSAHARASPKIPFEVASKASTQRQGFSPAPHGHLNARWTEKWWNETLSRNIRY
jgi:hypothetical protein